MLILFAFSPVILTAQDTQSSTGIKTICETFLKMIQAGDYNKAFSYIQSKPTSIPEQEFSEIEITAIQQSKTIRQLYGEARRAVLVSEKNRFRGRASPRISRYTGKHSHPVEIYLL